GLEFIGLLDEEGGGACMETYLIFNGNFFYIHSKKLLSNVVNGMTHCIDTCRLTLCYRKVSGLYSIFCNFGGFTNNIGDSFCNLNYALHRHLPSYFILSQGAWVVQPFLQFWRFSQSHRRHFLQIVPFSQNISASIVCAYKNFQHVGTSWALGCI